MPDLPPAFGPLTGDSNYPYQPAYALECGVCWTSGFAVGDIIRAAVTLSKAGWIAHPTRVLCPSCAKAAE